MNNGNYILPWQELLERPSNKGEEHETYSEMKFMGRYKYITEDVQQWFLIFVRLHNCHCSRSLPWHFCISNNCSKSRWIDC